MNAKSRRKVLNVAFKKFQRLPDWTSVKPGTERPEWKLHILPKPVTPPQHTSGSQALAE
jgi:hypothetical protein